MSESIPVSSELMRYMQRDATVWGRTVNTLQDLGRDLVRAPSLRTQAAQFDADQLKQRAVRDTKMNHIETALEGSGLGQKSQQFTLSILTGIEREYPGVNVEQMDVLINQTIEYVKDRARETVAQNQMNLFTEDMLNHTQPLDREAGIHHLENLARTLREVEDLHASRQDEKYIDAALGRVEDQMEVVYRDNSARAIAQEWGIRSSDFGLPLLSEHGTALHSTDITQHIVRERGIAQLEHENEPTREQLGLDMPDFNDNNAYAEAYANVAGDPTLSGRLENENPIDILNDVRNQARHDSGIER